MSSNSNHILLVLNQIAVEANFGKDEPQDD